MRKLVAIGAVLSALTFTAGAEAHSLTCDTARTNAANHPNANCSKPSPNHVYLGFPWYSCREHWYWSHVGAQHVWGGGHCWSWSRDAHWWLVRS